MPIDQEINLGDWREKKTKICCFVIINEYTY